ncbi:MAG TPA: thiamine pyrophosphate-dependent enzyme [Pseudonocardia sp.]|jgi:acetolactate synthase-1/2/3 large subunit|uniref:thiamine pyrophosphate-dependent enzyme n=1 Tax=Pseudonocardia sp. TaxID=60912 RepID=UPI002ED9C1A5
MAPVVDASTVIAGDSTMACYYGVLSGLPVHRPSGFLYPTGGGTLGYGLPAAIGAMLAEPEARVLALLGDGGIMFTLSELATAAQLGLGLPVLVAWTTAGTGSSATKCWIGANRPSPWT